MKEIAINKDWYRDLVTDIRKLEFTGIVVTKHAIGARILGDHEKFGKPEYGSKRIESLSGDLNINARELYRCIQFAEKCHAVTEFSEKSWRYIVNKYLPVTKEISEKPALPDGKYSVIYADPPWEHPFQEVQKKQYQAMSQDELRAMSGEVKEISARDCVLFLWATAPKLDSALDILKAWGFNHKTNFVWYKMKHNPGQYASIQHEIILIGGKGQATPRTDKKTIGSINSVQVIPTKAEHSAKPEEFRNIIDRLYPGGKKIELFARGAVPAGWDTWGNETDSQEEEEEEGQAVFGFVEDPAEIPLF